MKLRLIKAILFILIGGIVFFSINYKYMSSIKKYHRVEKFSSIPKKIDICNVGPSHTLNAFIYDEVKDKSCFNMALPGQSLQYDYMLLKQYKCHINDGAIVFISLSYPSFRELAKEQVENQNRRYYRFLKKDFIINYSYLEDFISSYIPVVAAGSRVRIISDSKNNEEEQQKSIEDASLERYKTFTSVPSFSNETIEVLDEMIAFVIDNNWQPVLVTTPITKQLNDHYSGDFMSKFHNQINYFVNKYNIVYVDYSHDTRFSTNLELFNDPDHLNLVGGQLFTKIVFEELNIN